MQVLEKGSIRTSKITMVIVYCIFSVLTVYLVHVGSELSKYLSVH